jgi:NAD(P)-dependent dehydrogenase (short-subunit alcohol dehydrogenase family)
MNKVALVTGSATGIGRACALRFAEDGFHVVVNYSKSEADARETLKLVEACHVRGLLVQCDVGSDAEVRDMLRTVEREFGRLDVLVNMASIYREKAIDALTLEDWDTQMAIDLRAAWLCSHAAIPHLRRSRGGRIVNFSDWVARSGRPRYPGYLPYYVAKAGVIALTEALALELAADQILVNAVAPGPIVAPPGTSTADSAAVERATPVGRWGGEIEIAKAVLALVESDFITGETIRVDGGRHLK